MEYYAGGAASLGPPSFQILLTTDATFPSGSPVLHHGLEWGIEKVFYIRGGYQWTLQPQQLQDQAGLGGGVGLHFGDFRFDYSITSNGDLGLTNKVAVGLLFGKPARARAVRTPVRVASVPTAPPASAAPPAYQPPAQPSTASPVAAPSGTGVESEKMITYYRRGIAEYKADHFQPSATRSLEGGVPEGSHWFLPITTRKPTFCWGFFINSTPNSRAT